jgi:SOS response associated peptidase (SRAP)
MPAARHFSLSPCIAWAVMAMIYTGRFQGRAARRKCGIITGELNEFVRQIHTRMPVILPEHQHDAWLGPTASRALRDLQSEGVIERRVGAGSFLTGAQPSTTETSRHLGVLLPALEVSEILDCVCQELASLTRSKD